MGFNAAFKGLKKIMLCGVYSFLWQLFHFTGILAELLYNSQ